MYTYSTQKNCNVSVQVRVCQPGAAWHQCEVQIRVRVEYTGRAAGGGRAPRWCAGAEERAGRAGRRGARGWPRCGAPAAASRRTAAGTRRAKRATSGTPRPSRDRSPTAHAHTHTRQCTHQPMHWSFHRALSTRSSPPVFFIEHYSSSITSYSIELYCTVLYEHISSTEIVLFSHATTDTLYSSVRLFAATTVR